MAPSTEPDKEALQFLKHRVANFGLFSGGFVLFFWVFRALQFRSLREAIAVDSVTHLASALCLLAAWVVLRRSDFGAIFVRITESMALLGSCALFVIMGDSLDRVLGRPEQTLLLALTFVTCSRSVYVPSSGRRTLLLNLVIGVALLAGTYLGYRNTDMTPYVQVAPELLGVTSAQAAFDLTINTGAWWTLSTGLAVATSRVTFGLRKAVNATRRLGQYQLEREIGFGGMGVVYEARHALLRRPTAVKLLPAEKAGEAAVQRFEREVKLTARLRHPNTITIYDYGRTPDGVFYYAMELLEGATLEQIVDVAGPQEPIRVAHVLRQTAAALGEAHELGLIHRDVKPSNLMLCNQGGQADVTKVLDFGLVKDVGPANGYSETQAHLTQNNAITGTPMYMAPEVLRNPEQIDARSDLYALGAVAYYLLSGTHLFSGATIIEICGSHLHELPTPLSDRTKRKTPPDLEALIMQCLEKAPDRRPQNAHQFLERLAECDLARWENSDARRWWDKHADAIQQQRDTRETSQTVAVDLNRRGS